MMDVPWYEEEEGEAVKPAGSAKVMLSEYESISTKLDGGEVRFTHDDGRGLSSITLSPENAVLAAGLLHAAAFAAAGEEVA